MNKSILSVSTALALLLVSAGVAQASQGGREHLQAELMPVGDSGVTGMVNVVEFPFVTGAHINVVAQGLIPGETYVSLYYENHTCDLEPYSGEDVIGEREYVASENGMGATAGKADDAIDEVNSVSVRLTSDFSLVACADLHP